MNPQDLALFTQATQQAGSNPTEAYQILKSLEPRNPADSNLLSWLVFTAPTYPEKENWVVRAQTFAPSDPTVQQAVAWFNSQPKPQAPALVPPPQPSFHQQTQPVMPPQQQQQYSPYQTQPQSQMSLGSYQQLPVGQQIPMPIQQPAPPVPGKPAKTLGPKKRFNPALIAGIVIGVVGVIVVGLILLGSKPPAVSTTGKSAVEYKRVTSFEEAMRQIENGSMYLSTDSSKFAFTIVGKRPDEGASWSGRNGTIDVIIPAGSKITSWPKGPGIVYFKITSSSGLGAKGELEGFEEEKI